MKMSVFARSSSVMALAAMMAWQAPAAHAQQQSTAADAAAPRADDALPGDSTLDGAAQQTDPAGATSGEIVVTGSRLGRKGYDAPTPVNVVGDERLEALGISNVGDALNQIPSFRAISTPASNNFRVSGNIAARTLDLRGLGPTRTLTLVDGSRFVGSSDNGTVDLNSIPSIMIERSEVVTGGASAAYGANAVAGVVNLILDTKMNGIKTDFAAGISERGDAANYYAAVKGGTDFAGGRGHVVAAIEYSQEDGIGQCENRDFCKKYTNYIANPGYIPPNATTGAPGVSTNGLPATLVLDNVMSVYNNNTILTSVSIPTAAGGRRTLGQQVLNFGTSSELPLALQGKQFDAGGNFSPYTFGNYLSGLFQQIRDTTQPYNLGLGTAPFMVPTKHVSSLIHAGYEVTDAIKMSAGFIYSHVVGGPTQAATPGSAGVSLGFDNPFLSDAARSTAIGAISPLIPLGASTATNRPKLLVNNSSTDVGVGNVGVSRLDTYRGVLGFEGKLFAGWDWDASYSYGRVEGYLTDKSNRLKTWNEGMDATRTGQAAIVAPNGVVMASATPSLAAFGIADGTAVCRSTLTNPTNGCVPINLFGPNSVSQAAIAQHLADEWQTRTYEQHAISANLRGSPFSTWAGEVRVALGGEWRRDSAVGDVDALSKAPFLAGAAANAGFITPQAVPLTSATRVDANGVVVADLDVPVRPVVNKVLEGYVEVSVPLLKDSALGKSLDIDGALRWSHYTPFGNATTWKVGGVYSPVSGVTFRVTKSRDVRAPTAAEANPLATVTVLPLPDPFVNSTHNVLAVTGGNPNLHLEKGDTFTAGIVLQPDFAPRFHMSVDYYNIKVKGAIDSLTGSTIATACLTRDLLCDLITFQGTPKASQIVQVQSTSQNLSQLHAEGLELVMDYSVPVFQGRLSASVNGNYVIDLSTVGATGLVTEFDNWTGNPGSASNLQGVPRWKADAVLTYAEDSWSLTAHGRYIPRGLLDATKIGPEQAGYDVNNPNSISTNRVDSRFYLDLSGSIRVDSRFEFYAVVSNVFDTPEPPQLRLLGNPLQFDPVMRAYRVGVRTSW